MMNNNKGFNGCPLAFKFYLDKNSCIDVQIVGFKFQGGKKYQLDSMYRIFFLFNRIIDKGNLNKKV